MRITFPAFFCFFSIVLVGTTHAAVAEKTVPRTIIGLYDGGEVQNSFIHTVAEMPLNQLGLTVEYHDIHQPLPDIIHRPDVRGVITWFYGDVGMDAEAYLKWAIAAVESGKKYVIVGSLGISENKQYYSASMLTNHFLDRMGFKMLNRWVTPPLNATYVYNTPSLFLTPEPYNWINLPYQIIHIENDRDSVHLAARRDNAPADDSDLIITGPSGGYIDASYAIRTNNRYGLEINQWMIDPFAFFRLTYATDDLPKPDATTTAGRRVYYSNIDGDGWNNVTQLQEYAGKHTLSSQVVLEKAIRPYPDLPVMVAPIVAEIAPRWVGSEDSRHIVTAIWSLPWVEAGTHTYSHPFNWHFFEAGNPNLEMPYLSVYKTPTWKPSADAVAASGKSGKLPEGYDVPRGFAVEPFDIHKEIKGSLDELGPLLPPGKKIDILAWSGDCAPWEEAVHMTREAGIQNINGGDTRFDSEYPAYASVAPIGRQVGKERQIYVSSSNENTYTDLWTKNFHAFRYLRKTTDNTETPMRIKPFSIYYHMFAGERESSLNALLSNLDYARTQDIAPISASAFTHMAEGFYSTQFVSLGDNAWRIEQRGGLSTIRFDQGSMKAVDFDRSQGVIGERHFQGSLYVYLDAAVNAPVITLKNDDAYYAPPKEKTPYLIESRWLISGLKRAANAISFTAQGFGNGEMVWQVATPGTYRITSKDHTTDVVVSGDCLLKLSLKESALTKISLTMTKVQSAPN